MRYRLEGDNFEPVDNPSWEEVDKAISSPHPKDRCYFSLNNVDTRSYVQLAGARLRLALTTDILDTIDHHIHHGEIVYLHCWGGVGRTGVIVGCWLSRHGFTGDAALARLKELWQECPKSSHRKSPETTEQEQYIVTWQENS
ncbi:MAG: protein-tyrosine phosphatase family protein [Desulfuromonadaceae bacterium]|nr:protein-tyrosine phosphatase family protein [Desulfuromonadaceae bacterium]MDD2856996.1 protein-tyrosine phosphatase family protein [Desulfuromonadaceae bacterium]